MTVGPSNRTLPAVKMLVDASKLAEVKYNNVPAAPVMAPVIVLSSRRRGG